MAKLPVPELNILILGDGGVGKTSLVLQFVQGIYVERHDTGDDSHRKILELEDGGDKVMLEIADTAAYSLNNFTAMRDLYIKKSDGFLLLYSTLSRGTLQSIQDNVDLILRVKEVPIEKIPIVLVGTKIDRDEDRAITAVEGVALANKLQCDFIEVSSKTKINVDQTFHQLTRRILAQKYTESLKKSNKTQNCVMM